MSKEVQETSHEHILPDGTAVIHSHSHHHPHTHSHAQTDQVLKRIANVIGHMHGISNMVKEGRDCSDVLIQLSAVNASLRKLKVMILKDHVEHCVVDAIREGDTGTIDKLNEALDKVME